jgi:hypothetical protein
LEYRLSDWKCIYFYKNIPSDGSLFSEHNVIFMHFAVSYVFSGIVYVYSILWRSGLMLQWSACSLKDMKIVTRDKKSQIEPRLEDVL